MSDKFSSTPSDYCMERGFRSKHLRHGGQARRLVAAQKRLARRSSRHQGAKNAIALGLSEAVLD